MSEIERNTQEAELVEEQARAFTPPVDIYETEDSFLLLADMPGLNPTEIDVRLDRETLVIQGTSEVEGLNKASATSAHSGSCVGSTLKPCRPTTAKVS